MAEEFESVRNDPLLSREPAAGRVLQLDVDDATDADQGAPASEATDTFAVGPHRFYRDESFIFCTAEECGVRRTDPAAVMKACPWGGNEPKALPVPTEDAPAFDDEVPF